MGGGGELAWYADLPPEWRRFVTRVPVYVSGDPDIPYYCRDHYYVWDQSTPGGAAVVREWYSAISFTNAEMDRLGGLGTWPSSVPRGYTREMAQQRNLEWGGIFYGRLSVRFNLLREDWRPPIAFYDCFLAATLPDVGVLLHEGTPSETTFFPYGALTPTQLNRILRGTGLRCRETTCPPLFHEFADRFSRARL